MSTTIITDETSQPVRRRRRAPRIAGIVAAILVAAGFGSYAAADAVPLRFSAVHSEALTPGATSAVSIADPASALTFARIGTATGPTVLAVTGYDGGVISGVDINAAAGTAFTEPIAAFTTLGYGAIRDLANDAALPRVSVPASETLVSLDTHAHHVGIGTNYVEHQAEATIHEPYLFPKMSAPTDSVEALPAGAGGLLDYEVELGLVALDDISGQSGVPQHMGLVLTNDWTDRELLMQQIEVDNLTGGAGFTNAKSQPGFLGTGDLFVVPADWQSYYRNLQLDLFVNGELRQRAHPSDMVWDGRTVIERVLGAGNRTWDSDGVQTPLTPAPGVISRGTIIQSGTPEGVVYRAPDTRQRFLGFMEYAGSLGTNADSVVDSALQRYVREAHEAGIYLRPGDGIVTRAEGLGQIVTTIVPGERAPSP